MSRPQIEIQLIAAVVAVACALLVFALLGACTYYWLAISRETFGDAWYDFVGGLGCKVYASVMALRTAAQ